MRRDFLFVAALLAAAVPPVTSAVARVDISDPTFRVVGGGTLFDFEVFATDLDGSDERLSAYAIGIDGPTFSSGGVQFVVPDGSDFGTAGVPIEHPYVFKDLGTVPTIENFGSMGRRLQFGAVAVGRDDEVNIDPTHSGLLRFSVLVPPTTSFGVYSIRIDPTTLELAGPGAPIVATVGRPGILMVWPEPSAATLLLAASLALLRRRRRAAAF